jgi:glycerol-3-phosphate dehydrogenase (NAD(P)+)
MRIAILGAGNLGTALGVVLAGGVPGIRAGRHRDVVLWTIETDVADEIAKARLNSKYLPGVGLPRSLQVTLDLDEALRGASVVVFALPSKVVREVARRAAPVLASAAAPAAAPALVSASKGLEAGTRLRMTEVIASERPAGLDAPILAMSGPSIAHEMARGTPTAVSLGHPEARIARAVRREIQTPILRFRITRDVVGVEFGGVLKNAYALLFGLCDGLGLGLNTKAALLTLAVQEMSRLGQALGARRSTFQGLPGLGDLVGTGLSDHSRNRRMGEELARRRAGEQALPGIPGVVEGLGSVEPARDLARRHGLRLPVLEGLATILAGEGDALPTILRLVG